MTPNKAGTPLAEGSKSVVLMLAGIVAGAVCLRVWLAFFTSATWYNTDTYLYFTMADGILHGQPLTSNPNGYPLIVASVKGLFGTALAPAMLVGLNVVLSTMIVLLCYGIGASMGSVHGGLLAAALMAVWPNHLNYTRQILSETPATFFLVLGIYLLVRRRQFGSGATLYLASLVRSTLLPVIPLSFLWMILSKQPRRGVVLFAVGAVVLFSTNLALQRMHVVAAPTNGSLNLLLAVQSSSTEGIIFDTDRFTPDERAHPLRTYLSFARDQPINFIEQRASSLWELWGPWPRGGDAGKLRGFSARLIIGLRFLLVGLALLEWALHLRSPFHWLLMIPILDVTAVHTVYFSTTRFSFCAEPLAIILCALLLSRLSRRSIEKMRGTAPVASPA